MKRKEILSNHQNAITELGRGRFKGYFQTFVVDAETGKRKIIRAKTKRELEEKLIDYYSDSVAEKHTIKECYDGWIEYIKINKKQSTIHTYEKVFKRHFGEIKDEFIEDLSGYDIKVFVKKEVAEKELTAKAYASLKTNLLGIFHYAKDRAYVDIGIEGVVSDLGRQLRGTFRRSKKAGKKDEEFVFFDHEVSSVLTYCSESGSLVDLGIILLFGTGLRVGELAALKKTDIENGFKALSISRTEERISNGADYIVSDAPKTDAGFRRVLITKDVSKVLKSILNKSAPTSEYLFADDDLDRYPAKKFRDRLYRICLKLQILRRSPHAIRRTYASKLFEAGVPEHLIIKQMGHIDFDVTKAFYIYNRKSTDEMIEELERAI